MSRTTVEPASTEDGTPVADFAPLTREAIAAQTDAGSFKRGQSYFRGGRIFAAFRRENTLRARCHGSSGGPYVVEVTLASAGHAIKRNPLTFACDCPRGGFCKHIVAVLLTWIERPESFEVRPPLADLLTSKSREELVALIAAMLSADPDLEELLALPAPVAGALSADAIDEMAVRRQVAAALKDDDGYGGYGHYGRYNRYDYDDYYAASRIAEKLERVVALAETYADAAHWRNALRVAAVLVDEVTPRMESVSDHDGDLYGILGRADAVLAAALDAQDALPADLRLSDEERSWLLDAMLTVWQADLDIGGVGMSQEGPEAIARGASPEEQRRVGDLLRQSLHAANANEWNRNWRRQEVIGFLSLLAGEAGLSDEELLTEYRNAELWAEATTLLLEMGRVDEAISLATRRLAGANALTPFADRLIATGDPHRIDQAIALIDDRLWEREGQNVRDDQMLREWLERQYAAHGRPEKALALAHDRFRVSPSRETYDAVKAAALLPGQPGEPWPALRQELLAALRKLGGWYALIDIFLAEGEIAAALEGLRQSEKPRRGNQVAWGYGWGASPDSYAARVAAAAEAEFPDESIRIYRSMADRLIEVRGRENYQSAASYLARVMRLLESNGRAEEWPPQIAELRQRNRSLRALREELDSLGLG